VPHAAGACGRRARSRPDRRRVVQGHRLSPTVQDLQPPRRRPRRVPDVAVGGAGIASFFSIVRVRALPKPRVTVMHKSGGRKVPFAIVGSRQSMWGLICRPGPTLTLWGAAETAEGNGPYDVRVHTYRVHGSRMVRISGYHDTLPQRQASRLLQNGGIPFGESKGVCEAPLLPVGKVR
jgi:hypothetical protein